jgi:hypothetical protein
LETQWNQDLSFADNWLQKIIGARPLHQRKFPIFEKPIFAEANEIGHVLLKRKSFLKLE